MVTFPVADDGVTVAVRVTGEPKTDGLGELTSVMLEDCDCGSTPRRQVVSCAGACNAIHGRPPRQRREKQEATPRKRLMRTHPENEPPDPGVGDAPPQNAQWQI
jgi:hypothetical protein